MTCLAAFLLARIAEDEERARATGPDYTSDDFAEQARQSGLTEEQWHTARCGWRVGEALDPECSCTVPARVLADCQSRRGIVELHHDLDGYCASHLDDPWPCLTLRLLALPYAQHPDFQQEWTP